MHRPFHQLLSIVLIFLLAALPLKIMAAEIAIDQNSPCHLMTNAQLAAMNMVDCCEQCDDLGSCNSMSSSSLSFALTPSISLFHTSSSSLSLRNTSQTASFQTISVLLRPPRA